jgi:ubiquinone/menaquinone biosynthesis C-methylase UbiE
MAITGSACAHSYDRSAHRYERWWLPVIAPATYRLLDRVAPDLEARPDATLVDVGAGTANLALAALRRWPQLKVVAVDASRGMLRLAREAATAAGEALAERLTLRWGEAAALPLRDGSADVVVSSFVLQLVPDRAAVLADVRRVLRPGGAFAAVTWRRSTETFAPEEAFLDVAEEQGFDLPPEAQDGRDFASPRSAAAELRRAGFQNVVAREEWIEQRWTPAEYLGLLENWVADDVFEGLTSRQRNRLRAVALARLSSLPPAAFVWRAALVSIRAEHPPTKLVAASG